MRKEIPGFPQWKKQILDKKAKARRKMDGAKEAREAEVAAKELGIYNEFYKDKASTTIDDMDGDGDYSALKALIQGKKRKTEAFLDDLATRYSDQARDKHGQKKSRRS
jgi:DnaJ homolog subfamily C member 9